MTISKLQTYITDLRLVFSQNSAIFSGISAETQGIICFQEQSYCITASIVKRHLRPCIRNVCSISHKHYLGSIKRTGNNSTAVLNFNTVREFIVFIFFCILFQQINNFRFGIIPSIMAVVRRRKCTRFSGNCRPRMTVGRNILILLTDRSCSYASGDSDVYEWLLLNYI